MEAVAAVFISGSSQPRASGVTVVGYKFAVIFFEPVA
jgi:hypothetical protein